MKLKPQWMVGLTLIFLTVGFLLWKGKLEPSPSRSDQAGAVPPRSIVQGAAHIDSSKSDPTKSESRELDPLSTFPIARTQGVRARYQFAKDCAKFRHFESFYRQKSADPNWPLNNPKAFEAADPDVRERLKATSAFLDKYRPICSTWIEDTPRDLANAQIYEASLQAALSGDKDAAACFILASWQAPDSLSEYYSPLAEKYAANTGGFVRSALSAGNWNVILAAYSAAQEQHGLKTRLGLTEQDVYLVSRLVQLGSPDPMRESEVGYVAASVATHLTAGDLGKLDKQASNLYARNFRREKVSPQSVTDMCVN